MNSIKELKEQLGYEEIGLDDIFVFHCTQCGKSSIEVEYAIVSSFTFGNKMIVAPTHIMKNILHAIEIIIFFFFIYFSSSPYN